MLSCLTVKTAVENGPLYEGQCFHLGINNRLLATIWVMTRPFSCAGLRWSLARVITWEADVVRPVQ